MCYFICIVTNLSYSTQMVKIKCILILQNQYFLLYLLNNRLNAIFFGAALLQKLKLSHNLTVSKLFTTTALIFICVNLKYNTYCVSFASYKQLFVHVVSTSVDLSSFFFFLLHNLSCMQFDRYLSFIHFNFRWCQNNFLSEYIVVF